MVVLTLGKSSHIFLVKGISSVTRNRLTKKWNIRNNYYLYFFSLCIFFNFLFQFFNSIRFYNPDSTSKNLLTDEKPLLKPGQHEYSNPVHFSEDYPDISPSSVAKKLNEMGTV